MAAGTGCGGARGPAPPLLELDEPPPQVEPGEAAVEIEPGRSHACARTVSSLVRCWGQNDKGQLGDGTTQDRALPVTVPGLDQPTSLALGGAHSCALLASGAVRCWGANGAGQLGDDTALERHAPVAVSDLEDAVQIAAGAHHTCARLRSGHVVCWGANEHGQLGDGTNIDRPVPVPVVGLSDVVGLALGGATSCALRADTTLVCWGDGTAGQMGDDHAANHPTPVAVPSLTGVTQVALAGGAGDAGHLCARLSDSTVRCWGEGLSGELGDGSIRDRSGPVMVAGLANAVEVAVGEQHSCARTSAGVVVCWGRGFPFRDSPSPCDRPPHLDEPVAWAGIPTTCLRQTVVGGLRGITDLAHGARFACALDRNGVVACWGDDTYGQLGDGQHATAEFPHTVPL